MAVPARATQPSLHPYCVQRISCDLMRYPPTNLGVAVPAHRSPAVVDWYVTRAIPLSPMLRTALVRCRFRRSADMPKRTACPFLVVVLHAVCHAYVCNRGTLWPCCARRAEPPARTGPFICAAVVCRCCSDQVHSTGRPEGYIFCACVFIAVPAVHCVERTTIAISSCLLQHSVHTLLASFVAGAVLWLRRHCGQRQQTGTPSDRERIETYTQRGDLMISLNTHMDGVSFVHGSNYEPRPGQTQPLLHMISPAARMQIELECAQQMRSPGAAGDNRAPAASGVSDISDTRTHCGHRAVQSALRSAAYHSVAGAASGGTHAVQAADARQLVSHAALPRKRGSAAADTHHESHLQM